jgi:hypothetical protein
MAFQFIERQWHDLRVAPLSTACTNAGDALLWVKRLSPQAVSRKDA